MTPIKYTLRIRQISTGKEVDFHDEMKPWDDDPTGYSAIEFLFQDGNYGCDCNRELFFLEAQNLPTDASMDSDMCGHTKYFCKATIDETGQVVFDELSGDEHAEV